MRSGSDRVDKSSSPLHPNISMYIIQTDLYIIPKVLTKRICLTIKSFFYW